MVMSHVGGATPHSLRASSEQKVLRSRRHDRIHRVVLGIGFPLLILVVWQLMTTIGLIDQRFFPSPVRVLAVAGSILGTPAEFWRVLDDVAATLTRVGIGYVLGAVSGIFVGACMGLYRPVRYAWSPIIYATFPTPKVAIFPLLIVIFGLGDSSKIALVTLGVFFMTCINTLSGVSYANPVFGDVAKAYKIPLVTQWTRIILPSALPSIIAGLKLGIGQALILVVAAEFVSSNDGIGYYIWNSWQILDISRMFVGLIIVSLLGSAAVVVSNYAERKLIPWANRR